MEDSTSAQPPSKPNGGIQVQIGGNVENSTVNIAGGDLNTGADTDSAGSASPPSAGQVALYTVLSTKFTLEELDGVCWELGIRFEDLAAKTLSGKARQLIAKAQALGLELQLSEIVERERPATG